MRWVLTVLLSLGTLGLAAAESPGVMFVLDGSGSMWGQIEGRAKIEIAKELMIGLVDDLPGEANTALIAYGHRRKGDCEDIEMLVPLGADSREAIIQQITALNPKGKTPITRALELAGESLRSVEEETTLVLISDGEETCDRDPCALVDQLLEQGLKLKVHVVGFDVQQQEREQLMCIAKAGNGNYFSADSAGELGEALAEVKQEVVKKIEQSVPREATFVALAADSGEPVPGPVEWTLINSATEQVQVLDDQAAELVLDIRPGTYEVFVMAAGATGEGQFEVTGEPGERFQISLAIQKKLAPFDSPASAAAGSVINFAWRGPNAKGDLIFIMAPNVANNRYPFSNRHETAKGPTASLTVPALPGIYEVRYFSMGNGTVLHRMPIEITPAQVLISAPASIPAGTPMSFTWSGPASPGDVLFIADANMDLSKYYTSNNHVVSKGDTATVTAPAVPGVYEVRYYSKRNGTVLFKKPLEVTEAQVTLDAPRTAAAGTRIEVNWSGPKSGGDLIFITEPNLDHKKYWTRNHNVSKGTPAQFTVPAKPGTYEIRYYSMQNGRTLAKRALIVR